MSEEVFSRWQDPTIEQLRKKTQEAGESLSKIANKIIQERDLYKEVIEEVREVINKMVHYGYEKNGTYYMQTTDDSEFGTRAEVLLQILDKAKEN